MKHRYWYCTTMLDSILFLTLVSRFSPFVLRQNTNHPTARTFMYFDFQRRDWFLRIYRSPTFCLVRSMGWPPVEGGYTHVSLSSIFGARNKTSQITRHVANKPVVYLEVKTKCQCSTKCLCWSFTPQESSAPWVRVRPVSRSVNSDECLQRPGFTFAYSSKCFSAKSDRLACVSSQESVFNFLNFCVEW